MIPSITFHPAKRVPGSPVDEPRFSILIPSWNNLPYLKCCVESLRKNSRYSHQIIVHVNEGIDGSLEWVKAQGLDYSYSRDNVGVCYGFNAPATLAALDYLVLSDDDYYYSPDWDYYLWEEVKSRQDIYFCISGTMIEHQPTPFSTSIIAPYDFGKTVQQFDESRFNAESKMLSFADWNGCNWYPMLIHRKLWNLVGGLSVEFTPGIGSDPDMMMKLWHAGVRYFKGVSASRVYHFTSRSTARVKRNDGKHQFLMKWKIPISVFFAHYLRHGQKFLGELDEPEQRGLALKLLRGKLKRMISVMYKK